MDVLLNNPSVLDDLSRCLDKELKVISYWLHLAYELKIPADVYRRFEGYTDFSPTIRMFDYLQATRPKLTVGDLNAALTRIYRMDLIKLVSKSGEHEIKYKNYRTIGLGIHTFINNNNNNNNNNNDNDNDNSNSNNNNNNSNNNNNNNDMTVISDH